MRWIRDDLTKAAALFRNHPYSEEAKQCKQELLDLRAKGWWPGVPSEVWTEILRGNIQPYIELVAAFRAAQSVRRRAAWQ